MAHTDPTVNRFVAVTDHGTEVELLMSAVDPKFELRFAAAGLPHGKGNTRSMDDKVIAPAPSLGRGVLALRGVHMLIAAGEIASLIYLWTCALTGRRGRGLNAALVVLLTEGAGLVAGHGDCPLGPLQQSLGDPVPLFEFVLSPRAAKRAVPALAGVTCLGMIVLIVRGRRP